ncbi:hypothetical protein HYR54_05455 [Candidatus Acetothermia bacterium]|nr:hypothetical protein [Candidatus Acetothermia bacterium]
MSDESEVDANPDAVGDVGVADHGGVRPCRGAPPSIHHKHDSAAFRAGENNSKWVVLCFWRQTLGCDRHKLAVCV